ncbi:MAG: DNA recombination protein RmuC, partial [Amphritea sp.]|nr:DNA recombination protein RmuC [Amphritea sp.]MBQ0783549.1 DNA recombination protein RmuC [Amphritea sp.]
LGSLLTPLKDQLGEFKRKVEDVYDKEAKDRRSLYEQITHLKELNQQMSVDAVNLTNALKGESKTQGNWGEVILERVLEQSGLRKGYEYETQVSLNEEGQRYMPDVIIRLPDDKDVIVDAKVSLTAYEQYCSTDETVLQDRALTEHLQSIRNHIRGLSEKAYQNLEGVRSLDFVLMFIPVEGAFLLALQQDKELFSSAYERNIILVSPSTLLVTLRTINNIWRYERQNRFAQEIAHRGGELHDKFVGFVESLDDVGRHLGRTQNAFDTAHKRLSSGRGNLVNQAASLHKLGVKNKKELDKTLAQSASESDPDAEQLEILDR